MPSALHQAAEMRIRKNAIARIKFPLSILFGLPKHQAISYQPIKAIPEHKPTVIDGLLNAIR